MNNFRLTGLPPDLPETGSDVVRWSQAVQLVQDSEIKCLKKTGGMVEAIPEYSGEQRQIFRMY